MLYIIDSLIFVPAFIEVQDYYTIYQLALDRQTELHRKAARWRMLQESRRFDLRLSFLLSWLPRLMHRNGEQQKRLSAVKEDL